MVRQSAAPNSHRQGNSSCSEELPVRVSEGEILPDMTKERNPLGKFTAECFVLLWQSGQTVKGSPTLEGFSLTFDQVMDGWGGAMDVAWPTCGLRFAISEKFLLTWRWGGVSRTISECSYLGLQARIRSHHHLRWQQKSSLMRVKRKGTDNFTRRAWLTLAVLAAKLNPNSSTSEKGLCPPHMHWFICILAPLPQSDGNVLAEERWEWNLAARTDAIRRKPRMRRQSTSAGDAHREIWALEKLCRCSRVMTGG